MKESTWRGANGIGVIDDDYPKKSTAPGVRFNKMEETIVTVAGQLFDEQGFDRTSMQDIADALGLARSSLYHYFDNKEQILIAGTDVVTSRRNRIFKVIRALDNSPTDRLIRLVKDFGELISANPIWIRVVLRDGSALPAGARQRDYESRMNFYNLLVETITAGIDEGEIRPVNEHAVALTILATLTAIQWKFAAEVPLSAEESAEVAVDVLLHGILGPLHRTGTNLDRGLHLIREGAALIERNERQRES